MDNYNSSFIDLLNSSSTNNDNTPSPNNPQNPNFSQNPNAPPYTNYPPHPTYQPYGNYPPHPNYPPHQNYPPHLNYPPQPNYQHFPPQPTQPNAPVRPNPNPVVVDEDEGPADAMGRRKWTAKEEEVLMGAFLTASIDPVVGNNQSRDSFWTRVSGYFNDNSGCTHKRGIKTCKNKFHAVNGKVTQFAGFYNNRSSHWQSGASDEQILAEALADYKSANKGKSFPFLHVWRMVKDQPKWKEQNGFAASYQQPGFTGSYQASKKTRVNEAGDYTSSENPETPVSQAESNYDFPTQPLGSEEPSDDPPPSVTRRPIGQKAAKRKGKAKAGETSQSTLRVEDVANYYQNLQLTLESHNEVLSKKNEIALSKAKDKAFFKLCQLRAQDTRNMTPEQLENHNSMIAYIREKYDF